jgi:hypothetical protein
LPAIEKRAALLPGMTRVYLDGSASMSGFASQPKPNSSGLWVLNSLIASLAASGPGEGGKVTFYRSGDGRAADIAQIDKPLSDAQVRDATRAGWYSGKDAPLDVPLAKALTRPKEDLTVVVTDLFLSDGEMAGQPFYALRKPLAAALRDDRAIGILGIRHNFNGTIYDIPGKVAEYHEAKSRPLMLLMIGPTDRILEFKRRIDSEFLKERPEESNFLLFTAKPNTGFYGIHHWGDKFIASTSGVSYSSEFAAALGAEKIPQIEASKKKSEPLTTRLALSDLWLKQAPAPARVLTDARIWRLTKKNASRCLPSRWDSRDIEVPPLAASLDQSLSLDIEVLPQKAREDVDVGRYLVAARMTFSGIDLEQRGKWLTKWGFNEPEAATILASKPAFFPTLNLARLGNALRDVLAETLADMPAAEIAVAINLKH